MKGTRSDDLIHWQAQPPLSRPGEGFGYLEVPQVEVVEGRPVLVFSCLGAGLSDERRKAGIPDGRFIGELTDPMPIGWATDGSALKLDVAAPVTDATPGQSSLPHRTGGIPNGTDTSRSRGKGLHGRREGRRRSEP